MNEVNYFVPSDVGEAVKLKAQYGKDAAVLAGGTDLLPNINYYESRPKAIVYLGDLALNYIKQEGDQLVIGALTTIAKLLEDETIAAKAPMLHQACADHSSPAIRSAGTIGGNVMNASPAADLVPPLMAMDAAFVLAGAQGERTVQSDVFFTGPGCTVCPTDELLKEIRIPTAPGGSAYIKLGKRKAQCLSVVSVAVWLDVQGGVCKTARIALGSVAPTVIRCPLAEQMLLGQTVTPELLRKVAEEAIAASSPIDDSRATAWYRKEAGKGIVRQALFAAAGLDYTD